MNIKIPLLINSHFNNYHA